MGMIDFNMGWRFSKYGEANYSIVNLPHDAMLHEPRDPECDNSYNTGFYPGGKYNYVKKWMFSTELENQQYFIEFEGIYKDASIYINDKLVAERPGGYAGFVVDCTPFINLDEENEIRVVAENSKTPNSRWYSGSGIYRPVWLHTKGGCHIQVNGVKIETVSIDPPTIAIDVACTDGEVDIEILDSGCSLVRATGENVLVELPADKVSLWSEENPALYECKVTLKKNDMVVDESTVNFGIRKVSWSTQGLFINGKETKLRGACIHHDNGVLGACAFSDAEERKVRMLREAGFNAIRSSHNPCSQALLEAADKYGLYVMDEFSDVWYRHKTKHDYASDFDNWFEEDIRSMVDKDFNHPSVIMYSIGNENGETCEERGIELSKRMRKNILEKDSSRVITCGVNFFINGMTSKGKGVFKDEKEKPSKKKKPSNKKRQKLVGSELYNVLISIMGSQINKAGKKSYCDKATVGVFSNLDICGYNYGDIRYLDEARLHPERIIVGSETKPPKIAKNWEMVESLSYVVGDFMWTGWDYLGEAGLGAIGYSGNDANGMIMKKYPYLLSDCGVIDICGWYRPEVWLNRAAWKIIGENPYIGVEPVTMAKQRQLRSMWRKSDAVHSWSWHGCEGWTARIVVYSGAASVELLLNGKSLGKKAVKEKEVHFKTKYVPGQLVAINYDSNGVEIGRDNLKTASDATQLTLMAETNEISANGQDLAYLNIYLTDSEGEIKPAIDKAINVTVEGKGVLQGLGSANPCTEERFTTGRSKTYYGRALAVIRAGYEPGDIYVTVKAQGIGSKTVKIICK